MWHCRFREILGGFWSCLTIRQATIPLNLPCISLGSQGSAPALQRKKHSSSSHVPLPFHFISSSATPQLATFTPLYFTSFSPIHIHHSPMAPCLLSRLISFSLPPSVPQWEEGNRVSSFESDGALTGWNLCPIPRACSCARALQRLPSQTHIHTETVGIHPPTHMHAYIYRAGKGAHMCT